MKTIGSRVDEDGPVHIVEITEAEYRGLHRVQSVCRDRYAFPKKWKWDWPESGLDWDFVPAFFVIYRFAEAMLMVNDIRALADEFEALLDASQNETDESPETK